MKWFPILFFALAFAGCEPASNSSNPPRSGNDGYTGVHQIQGVSRYSLAEPIVSENLTVIPVVLSTAQDAPSQGSQKPDEYITLSEAKQKALVEIHEIPGNEQVGSLEVKNLGERPLLLLAGELLLGGKQDRVVAKDTVVPPGEMIRVPVFCVEQGRWTGETGKFVAADSMVPQSVRRKAAFGTQSEVWDRVYTANQAAKASPSITSVRGGWGSEKVQSRIETNLAPLREALARHPGAVGMVCAINGEIETLELFGSPGLFRASCESLLKGFLAEAALNVKSDYERVSLATTAAFVRNAMSGDRRQTRIGRGEAYRTVAGAGVIGREATAPNADATAAPSKLNEGFLHGTYAHEAK